ncbi:DUF5977 domain-containing protein [Niabella sp. 22666]|uniref:DUF5977 domain-containing protein n=1 Tax=Niabella sp. 22666 TaxID=3453954 RepID=UPI003F84C4FB
MRIIFILFLFIGHLSWSQPINQTLGKIVSASPDGSSIALYQNYPVDFVSGAPKIEVPLFEVKTGVGNIPFKLSYHIGKIKPSELAGPAGWGWTLSPNLGVSRSVKGGADGVGKGYPANSSFGGTSEPYLYAASNNTLDEQPDDFYYSLLGKSGQFIYNRQGGFSTLPYAPVKIQHLSDNEFTIIDDDGTTYRFGRSLANNLALEYAGGASQTEIASWRITEIIPYDNSDQVSFVYGNKKTNKIPYFNLQYKIYEYPAEVNTPVNVFRASFNFPDAFNNNISAGYQKVGPQFVNNYYNSIGEDQFDFAPPLVSPGDYFARLDPGPASTKITNIWNTIGLEDSYYNGSVLSETTVEQMPLTEINFRGGQVKINYSGGQISSIELYSEGVLIKRVNLFQHALTDNDGFGIVSPYYRSLNTRYALDSIKIAGKDLVDVQAYRFGYANGYQDYGVYANYNTDFWGFYNGLGHVPRFLYKVDNYKWYTGLLNPSEDPNYPDLGAEMFTPMWIDIGSRQGSLVNSNQSSLNILPSGLITRISYPTGGFAEFEYERNRYLSSTDVPQEMQGGGFRIKTVKYINGDDGNAQLKMYKYGLNEDGIGRVKYKNYWQNFAYQQWINSTTYGETGNRLQKITTVNSKPFLDMNFASGAAILYPEVAEYIYSSTAVEPVGKNIYRYMVDTKADNWIEMTPIQADQKDDWKIVVPLSEEIYRYKNAAFQLINKKSFTYNLFTKDVVPAAQTFLRYFNTVPQGGSDYLYGSWPGVGKFAHLDYNITTGARKLVETRDSVFDPDNNRFLVTSSSVEYELQHLLTKKITKATSKGALDELNYWYAFQGSSVPDAPTAQLSFLNSLNNANRISFPVNTKEYRNSTLLKSVLQTYQTVGSIVLPASVKSSLLQHGLEDKIHITLYDSYGNVLEQQKSNDEKEVYIWGYRSRYPVAKVIGASHNAVAAFIDQSVLDNPATTEAAMRTELDKIRTGLAGSSAQVFTYTYLPMVGVTSEKDAKGVTLYYKYDGFNRVVTIIDDNQKMIKSFDYKYGNLAGSLYWNDQQQQTFTKDDCPVGTNGAQMTYIVPANRYSSAVSKQAANSLALLDITQNGQTYVNNKVGCTSGPPITINGNNYANENGWRVTFTNTATSEVFDFEIPATVRGPIGEINKGTYNIRIYRVPAASVNYYFLIGGTTTVDVTAQEGVFTNVPLLGNAGHTDHVDIF